MSVGQRIKQEREQRGWSQGELARRSGVLQGVLSRIESGARKVPRSDTLQQIAAALAVSTDYLLGTDQGITLPADQGLAFADIDPAVFHDDDERTTYQRAWSSYTPKGQREIAGMLQERAILERKLAERKAEIERVRASHVAAREELRQQLIELTQQDAELGQQLLDLLDATPVGTHNSEIDRLLDERWTLLQTKEGARKVAERILAAQQANLPPQAPPQQQDQRPAQERDSPEQGQPGPPDRATARTLGRIRA